MSINGKLFLYCLAFASLLAGLAWLSIGAAGQAHWRPLSDYAATQLALDRLHDARERSFRIERSLDDPAKPTILSPDERTLVTGELRAIVADLGAVASKAASEESRRAADGLLALFSPLDAAKGDVSRRLLLRDLAPADDAFGLAFEAYRGDAETLGGSIAEHMSTRLRQDLFAIGACLSAVLLGAVWMSASLVRRVRQARKVAEAIAEGRLDVDIPRLSTREFDDLFSALRAVRKSASQHKRHHETLLLMQATSFDTTLATQHHRFVAAVNNMSQGLCMLDKDLNLIAFNEPFSELFPHFRKGATAEDVHADPRFNLFLAPHETGAFEQALPCGRMLEVKRRGVTGGGLVMTFEDITERHRIAQQLTHIAGHDGLTDLPNRRAFRQVLQAALSAPSRSVAVLSLDLNGFKTINDTLGHPIGDALLVAVGERLTSLAGAKDIVARLGGDEFALLQPGGAQPGAAIALAEAIVSAFAQPFEIEGRVLQVGIGIGIATLSGGALRGATADLVMQNGDLALYRAKAEGRSAYSLYDPQMRDEIEARRGLDADLRMALGRGELEVHYQPFIDVERRSISGFEALLRWHHPTRGTVPPAQFIPIAEELGLIDEIGLWVLGEACREAATWPAGLNVSVNLSPVQFRNPRLVENVAAVFARSRLEPHRLQLEVTESLFLDNTEAVIVSLKALRRLGALVAMDDFGTGYSSLGYLTRFPFDKIKIDQSFVRDIHMPESRAVIRAVIGLSRAMNMAVIAEGIETAEQYGILRDEGCREMQGYLFSPARPASDLPKLLMSVSRRWDALTAERPKRAVRRPKAA